MPRSSIPSQAIAKSFLAKKVIGLLKYLLPQLYRVCVCVCVCVGVCVCVCVAVGGGGPRALGQSLWASVHYHLQ